MTLGSLLTIIGVILAIYALAKPPQRKSIRLFVPLWVVVGGLSISGVLLIVLEVFAQWDIRSPGWSFGFGIAAFLLPIMVTLCAVVRWHRARLTNKSEPMFKAFLLSCLRDGEYDESVRILTRNRDQFARVLTEDTADLIFDPKFIHALVSARTWLHLELLTDETFLQVLPNVQRAVDRTIREFLAADYSPLRAAALLEEGGDETIGCTDEEMAVIDRTLLNPAWYHRCRAGYPLVIAACERIDSGELDDAYNRPDARFGALQGITSRSKCPVFLAEKTIAHALKAAIKQNSGTTRDTHSDAADLWDIFKTVYKHSVYRPETWDEPFGFGDYPTPFGFLLAEILSDYYFIGEEALRKSTFGARPPPEILAHVIRIWACCVVRFTKDEGHVSPQLRRSAVVRLLEKVLEMKQAEVHVTDDRGNRASWTRAYVDAVKGVVTSTCSSDQRQYVREVIDGMDVAKDHISQNRDWLLQELGLDGSGGAARAR